MGSLDVAPKNDHKFDRYNVTNYVRAMKVSDALFSGDLSKKMEEQKFTKKVQWKTFSTFSFFYQEETSKTISTN